MNKYEQDTKQGKVTRFTKTGKVGMVKQERKELRIVNDKTKNTLQHYLAMKLETSNKEGSD